MTVRDPAKPLPPPPLSKGLRVEVRYGRIFYPALISADRGHMTYDVIYESRHPTRNVIEKEAGVPAGRIRLIPAALPKPFRWPATTAATALIEAAGGMAADRTGAPADAPAGAPADAPATDAPAGAPADAAPAGAPADAPAGAPADANADANAGDGNPLVMADNASAAALAEDGGRSCACRSRTVASWA